MYLSDVFCQIAQESETYSQISIIRYVLIGRVILESEKLFPYKRGIYPLSFIQQLVRSRALALYFYQMEIRGCIIAIFILSTLKNTKNAQDKVRESEAGWLAEISWQSYSCHFPTDYRIEQVGFFRHVRDSNLRSLDSVIR